MRQPKYMSPTSLKTFESDQQEYYLRYLADERPPRFPQTQPMSIGSSFDAHVKAYLHESLFGKGSNPAYELDAIFTAQVEEHNRDWARAAGLYAFNLYKKYGALADLMLELEKSIGDPRFEFTVQGAVGGERLRTAGVPLLGKPDVSFLNLEGMRCIFDWKVNGFCSKRGHSPMKGYAMLRGDEHRNLNNWHKDAMVMDHRGMKINVAHYLEDCNVDWATQITIYGWLLGEDIGGDFIAGIDQLACKPITGLDYPAILVAEHRTRISEKFQVELFDRLVNAWAIINSDHFFRDLSIEESQEKCKALDGYAKTLEGDGSSQDKWFADIARER